VVDERVPNEEELRQALEKIRVADVLVNSLMAAVSLGFRHVSAEARDLDETKLAIESLRALEPVLREGGVEDAVLRDLEQARANLQLAYATVVSETSADERPVEEPEARPEETPVEHEPNEEGAV
jgi:hypothetical protein